MSAVESPRPSALPDLSKFSLAKLRARPSSRLEQWMKYLGFPLGIVIFFAIWAMPAPEGLSGAGQTSLAAFAMALVWWTTEPIPTHLTSIALIVLLVLFNGWGETQALGVLGLDVIWLNIMAFILASMMVKTRLAQRISLWLIVRFGRRARSITLAFLLMQVGLAALIPATAARAVMTLPLILTVAAIYGSSMERPNKFGRAMLLNNLHCINTGSAAYVTGSSANLIAVAFILSMGGVEVFYSDWFLANAPIVLLSLLASWYFGQRWLFRLSPEEQVPQLEGGVEAIRAEYEKLGPMRSAEWRTIAIFLGVLFFWTTDRFHTDWFGFEISAVMAAALGALVALAPRIGVLDWNEADIPWHLMLFSAGAYAGGLALKESGAARYVVAELFATLGVDASFGFWKVYALIVAVNMFSHILFTSKTMRTLIMLPFVITTAQQLGYPVLALALPAAFSIDWVNTLPINAKPNVVLFTTGQYSVVDSIKAGLFVTAVGTLLYLVAGLTWFKLLGITAGVP